MPFGSTRTGTSPAGFKFKNSERSNYLRDGNVSNFKVVINYLLKNYNYKIFLTGDIDDINISHKKYYEFFL